MRTSRWLALAVLAAACGGGRPVQYPSPQALFDESLAAYRRGDCGFARRGFERLTRELPPRDPQQAEVRYYLAECTLRGGDQLEAARQFRRVADDFARHPLAPDALLRAGDAYRDLWRDPELDPTYGETALATYRELVGRYADTPAAQRAQLRIRAVNGMLAAKEFRNGVFYFRLRAYDSAIIYFKDVIAKYPLSPHAPLAVLRLIETYDRIRYDEEKQEMCQYLRQYYPQAADGTSACPEGAAAP